MPIRSGLLALAVFVAAGCGAGPTTFGTAQEAYDAGVAEMEDGDYARAIEHFRAALDFGRTSELADDAQLNLARSYAGDGQYLLAGSEFTRFIEFYRTDPRIEQAAFERIQAYAELSPRYELDQTDTRQALSYIRIFVQQYPDSPNVPAAEAIAADLREKLAHKMYDAGRLYERREYYEAAVISYRDVLNEYPASEYADDALLGALRAQVAYADNSVEARQLARYRAALDLYDQLTTLFPQSPTLAEAQGLYDRAYAGWRAAGGEQTASE
jgi:outer membrane protein assembly factor BamD